MSRGEGKGLGFLSLGAEGSDAASLAGAAVRSAGSWAGSHGAGA